ncbi:MAG: hypothetical protein M3251_05365 [Thermoproteota archaeon]|nr:hypothetical protein [Thermoproteota archaeon]
MSKRKKKIQMPGAARAGIGLLIIGALLVGFGQYLERGALSLYGVIIVASGFVLTCLLQLLLNAELKSRMLLLFLFFFLKVRYAYRTGYTLLLTVILQSCHC